MRRFAPFALLAVIVAAPLVAQDMKMPDKAPGVADPKLVTKGKYKIDPFHTQAIWTVNHLGFTEYSGMFVSPTGSLVLDPANPAASKIEVTFPIANSKSTIAELDTQIQGPTLFDAAKFPNATFVSTKVVANGSNATITGDLALHGVTRPVVLKARFVGAGREFWGDKKLAFGFAATTSIKRSDFGMNNSIPLVSDRVDLTINAGFEAE